MKTTIKQKCISLSGWIFVLAMLSSEKPFAQTLTNNYVMNISLDVIGFGHQSSSTCNSRCELTAVYQSGRTVKFATDGLGNLDPGSHDRFNHTLTFTNTDKILYIQVYSGRWSRHDYVVGYSCENLGEGTSNTSTVQYPCSNITDYGKFAGYDGNSSITINVVPQPKIPVINLQSSFTAVDPSGQSSYFDYTITVNYTDGTQDYLYHSGYLDGTVQSFNDNIQNQSNKLIQSFTAYDDMYYYSPDDGSQVVTCSDQQVLSVGTPSSSYTGSFSNFSYCLPDAAVTISTGFQTYSITASDNILSTAEKINLNAPSPNPAAFYDWQYSLDGSSWTSLPAAFQGQSSIWVSATDILGNNAYNIASRNVFIKNVTDCSPASESYTLPLSVRLSSPHIASVTPIPNKCYGESNGSMKIQFDRALLPNETLSILVNHVPSNAQEPTQFNVTLAADNTFTWPAALSADNYTIALIGTYPNSSVVTYTGAPTHSASVSIVSPPALSYTATKQNDVRCYGGSDGAIGITASGGVGNYRAGYLPAGQSDYTWIPFSAASQTSLSGLAPDSYSLRVMDGNSCVQRDGSNNEVIATIPINQPTAPLQLDYSQLTNPLAYGYSDGQITAVLKGGTPNPDGSYAITWTDPLGNGVSTVVNSPLNGSYQTILQNGGNGSYSLQATDANFALAAAGQQDGCILKTSFTLVQPPPLIVSIEQTKIVTCHGLATAQLVAHGQGGIEIPVTRYQYQWYRLNNGSPAPTGQNDSVLSQLQAGDYQVMITDQNSITKTSATFTITEPGLLAVTITTTPLACNGDSTGIATPTISGGTAPYKYNWSTGDTTAVIGGLTEGGYFLFVTDSNACQAQQVANVTSPFGLQIDSLATSPTCHQSCDGSIVLNVSGGAGGYTYLWNTGASVSAISGLCAAAYNVQISDQNGCKATRSFVLQDPSLLSVNAGKNTTLCTGQTYQADATIADPAAVYQWGSSNGFAANTPVVSLSDSGAYWVTVTDSHGCYGQDSFLISRIDKDIAADFLVSTQVFQGQQVTIVNISHPDPDSINWMVPDTPAISIVSEDSLSATLLFNDTGSYSIGLKAWLAPCWKTSVQRIVVLQAQSFDDPGTVGDPLVSAFTVTPNPSSGEFTVHITLSDAVKIRLRMISVLTDVTVDDRQASGSSQYDLPYHMGSVAKGEYFLLLETPKGNSVYKVMIL